MAAVFESEQASNAAQTQLKRTPELKLDYLLCFDSLSSFKIVIMQKLVFYLDRIPTLYRDGIDF